MVIVMEVVVDTGTDTVTVDTVIAITDTVIVMIVATDTHTT